MLDASVVLKWFRKEGERHVDIARSIRAAYEAGNLGVTAPPLIHLEILNIAGRKWRFGEKALEELAESLEELGFDLVEPERGKVARWVAKGLTAYDAAYVAVAEAAGVTLITDDELIVELAPEHSQALNEWAAEPDEEAVTRYDNAEEFLEYLDTVADGDD